MLIATQTPDSDDPPDLHELTRSLAGTVGGTLFSVFGNPVLLRDLWPQVREGFSRASLRGPETTPLSLHSQRDELTRRAVDLVLERLQRAGRRSELSERIAVERPNIRARLLERCRVDGVENAKRLLLYCGHPQLRAAQRIQALAEMFLGLGCNGWVRALRGANHQGFEGELQTFDHAQAQLKSLGRPGEETVRKRLPEALEAIRNLYHLELAGAPRSNNDAPRLGVAALWAARWASEAFGSDERTRALLAELLLLEARHPARWAFDGSPVHLCDQDRSRWDRDLIGEAGGILARLDSLDGIGREQHRARIQWTLMGQPEWERTDWSALVLMFRGLEARIHSPAASLGTALAAGSMRPSAGLRVLEQSRLPLADERYLAARGALLARLGELPAALRDLRRAERLTPFTSQARSLARQIAALEDIDRNIGWGPSEAALAG